MERTIYIYILYLVFVPLKTRQGFAAAKAAVVKSIQAHAPRHRVFDNLRKRKLDVGHAFLTHSIFQNTTNKL